MLKRPAVLAALLLAGCGGQEPASAPAPQAAAPSGPVIPAAYLGAWDQGPAECAQSSTPTRITLAADTVGFMESLGQVTAVDASSPDAVLVTAAMEGEGRTWEGRYHFQLSPDGQSLTELQTVLEIGADGSVKPPTSLVRQKCAA